MSIGPSTEFSRRLHETKYLDDGEDFDDYAVRYARTTADTKEHFHRLVSALREQRILPAGRQQLAVGRPHQITAFNCFVGSRIKDSMDGIFTELKRSALTLRTGGGCGWDFSTLRPKNERINGLGFKAYASGPVSFMLTWDAMCSTVMSAGERRGAMMGVLRCDHPDIMEFVNAKTDNESLRRFNISVAATDAFMDAVDKDGLYELRWGGRSFGKVRALDVWSRIMERNWDYAEPGVLYIDRINEENPLSYCETIAATNPCGEQPLPPNGACLLLSLNIVKYLVPELKQTPQGFSLAGSSLDWGELERDVRAAVRACDNVIDSTHYPLQAQETEAKRKRRMGVGVTGMANALEIMGLPYGSLEYLDMQDQILEFERNVAYEESIRLSTEKGSFPLFDAPGWLSSGYASKLPLELRRDIGKHGLRNGLLLSIAPNGTISLAADNVSSGIEPPYSHDASRVVQMPSGPEWFKIQDYAYRMYGVRGQTAHDVSAKQHIDTLCRAQHWIDSAVSKTCNVNGQKLQPDGSEIGSVPFEEFKELYLRAYRNGAKGCTTFNINGKRFGIFKTEDSEQQEPEPQAEACTFDPETGARSCDA